MNELEQIKEIKERFKLSQKDIASMVNMTEGTVSRWFSSDPVKRREPNGAAKQYINHIHFILKGVL